jgi:hypothetical protein
MISRLKIWERDAEGVEHLKLVDLEVLCLGMSFASRLASAWATVEGPVGETCSPTAREGLCSSPCFQMLDADVQCTAGDLIPCVARGQFAMNALLVHLSLLT